MKEDNVIVDKSKAFALRIIKLYKYLVSFDCKEILKILMSITKTQNDIKRSETE